MNRKLLRGVAFIAAAALLVPPPALAQTAPEPPAPQTQAPAADRYNAEQLDALLAQIALYPDDLLAQVLMASTYPLQIVEASRWLGQGNNKSLTGDALVKALEPFNWDPSVKSLVPFPQVLSLLDNNLDWTQQLGYAFATQEPDVWNSVQRLRAQAQSAGHLQSTPQQTVTSDNGAYVIQPADPQTVYVPVYNPSVVYGGWPYPSYPPVYYPPPPSYYPYAGALATGLAFAAGAAVVGSLWAWSSPRWSGGYGNWGGSLNVNAARYNNINVNRAALSANGWRAPAGGVAGRPARPPGGPVGQPGRVAQLPANAIGRPNVQVPGNLVRPGGGNAQRPGGGLGGGGGVQRPGGPGGGNITRPGGQPGGGGPIQRPGGGAAQRPGGGGGGNLTRPGGQPGGGASQRPAGGINRGQAAAQRPAGAFGGVSEGARAGQFSQRGAQSRNFAQQRGGGGARNFGAGRGDGGGGGARAGGGGGRARGGGGGGRRGR